jgi:alkaline phosphatase
MLKKLKRISLLFIIILPMAALLINAGPNQKVKNVIIMIPDGMSVDGTTLARWFQGGMPLALDELACGLVKTSSADAPIADSAPAATAYATGFKSHTGYVGVLPDSADMPGQKPIAKGDEKKPVANLFEAARISGRATGLVVTCQVPHATPAGFSAHYPDRNAYDVIVEQQVYDNLDVMLGGGWDYLSADKRKDKEDLVAALKNNKYDYVTSRQEMLDAKGKKIWGLFAPDSMSYDLDKKDSEPSLSEMTGKAIDLLSKNPKGFILMVEGSEIDWAAHANDPVGLTTDILAFDKAVKTAKDFALKDKNTIVIIMSDHGNSGITMGNKDTTKGYDSKKLTAFIDPLKKAKVTGLGIAWKLNADRSNIKDVMAEYFGITDLTDEEVAAIKDAKAAEMNYITGPIMAKRAFIGFTTGGHTGEDVVLYCYSPLSDRPTGVIENTDVAKYIERDMGLNLADTTSKLFVKAGDLFKDKATLLVDGDNGNANNPALIVFDKKNNGFIFPANKNYVTDLSGKVVKTYTNGLNINNTINWYLPQEALSLMK